MGVGGEGRALGPAGFSVLWLEGVALGRLDTAVSLLPWDLIFTLFSEWRNGCRHRITKTKSLLYI